LPKEDDTESFYTCGDISNVSQSICSLSIFLRIFCGNNIGQRYQNFITIDACFAALEISSESDSIVAEWPWPCLLVDLKLGPMLKIVVDCLQIYLRSTGLS